MKHTLIKVICPHCQQSRNVRASDWRKRKSDLCRRCRNRAAAGLPASIGHSGKGTRLYNIWKGMRQRCGYVSGGHARDLEKYRDRGITVCDEWANDFCAFEAWAKSNGYADDLVIDRKDNNLGYFSENCRWVTVTESNRNKRTVLSVDCVAQIKALISYGKSNGEIAAIVDTSADNVRGIRNGRTFRGAA